MNKHDKQVIERQLEDEKAVLKDLERQYKRALADINERIKILQADDSPSRAYQTDYQETLKAQVEAILEKLHADEYDSIHKYLSNSYTSGYVGTMYAMGRQSGIHVITPLDQKAAVKAIVTDSKLSADLYAALGYDMDKLKKHVREEITRGIATSLPYEQIARNISGYTSMPLSNANRIVRTEGHRIQQASADDARNAAKAKGADVVKQWDASLDGATRKLHRELDGQIREVDEPFEAGGKKVMYPGKFGDPSQDCNCRCVALTRARWALDETELRTLKERAKFFDLDKTKDFEEYKKKYLKADAEIKTPVKTFASDDKRLEGFGKIKGEHDFIEDLKDANPNGYTENCQQCCIAYEARRRGYNVIAQDTLGQRYLFEEAFEDGKSCLVHLWKGISEMKVPIGEIRQRLEKQMREFGDGSRVFVHTHWDYNNNAHVFVAENHKGKIVYLDPQTGDTDFSDAWERMHRNTSFIRIDDRPFTDAVRDAVKRKKK